MNVRDLGTVVAVVFILIFVATAVLTLLSIIGKVSMPRGVRNTLFTKLVLGVIGSVVFLFQQSFSSIAYTGTITGLGPQTTAFSGDVYYGSRAPNMPLEWMSTKEGSVELGFRWGPTGDEECRVSVTVDEMLCGDYLPRRIELVYDNDGKRLQVKCNGKAKLPRPLQCVNLIEFFDKNQSSVERERSAFQLIDSLIGTAVAQDTGRVEHTAANLDEYLDLLGSSDPQLRFSAFKDLVSQGERALPVIEKGLTSANRTVRLNTLVFMRIAKWRPANKVSHQAFMAMVGGLIADDAPVTLETIKLLDTYLRGSREVLDRPELVQDVFLDVMAAALQKPDAEPRAVELLVKAGAVPQLPPRRYYELLGLALSHRSAAVREESAQALAIRPEGEGARTLLPKLESLLKTEKSRDVIDDAQRASAAIVATLNDRQRGT